MDVISAFSK